MHEINLKSGTEQDLDLISDLAARIWKEHYTPIIGEAQVNYMLEKMYSKKSLLEQVNIKNHIFYLIATQGQTLGFISVNLEKEGEWFLNKFYVLGGHAGRGVGTKALAALLKIIRAKKITLTVNRQNYKSVNFYFKNGFKIDHVADFDIGDGYVMNDFVMIYQAGR